MSSSPQKRKNPFGNLVNVLKQKSRYDTNVDALYGILIWLEFSLTSGKGVNHGVFSSRF